MSAPIVFVDTETTGLHPDRHLIWEVGAIRVEDGCRIEREWQIDLPDGHERDPKADEINRFNERRRPFGERWSESDFCSDFGTFTAGCHLAGAVVSFDEERLRRMFWRNGESPDWHYHLIDVENLAVGYLAGIGQGWRSPERRMRMAEIQPPWDSDDLTAMLSIPPVDETARHTALGDARWAEAIYRAVMG